MLPRRKIVAVNKIHRITIHQDNTMWKDKNFEGQRGYSFKGGGGDNVGLGLVTPQNTIFHIMRTTKAR